MTMNIRELKQTFNRSRTKVAQDMVRLKVAVRYEILPARAKIDEALKKIRKESKNDSTTTK